VKAQTVYLNRRKAGLETSDTNKSYRTTPETTWQTEAGKQRNSNCQVRKMLNWGWTEKPAPWLVKMELSETKAGIWTVWRESGDWKICRRWNVRTKGHQKQQNRPTSLAYMTEKAKNHWWQIDLRQTGWVRRKTNRKIKGSWWRSASGSWRPES